MSQSVFHIGEKLAAPAESLQASGAKQKIGVLGSDIKGFEILGYVDSSLDGPPILKQRTRSFFKLPSGKSVTQNDVEWLSHKITMITRHAMGEFRVPIDSSGGILVEDLKRAILNKMNKYVTDEMLIHTAIHQTGGKMRYLVFTTAGDAQTRRPEDWRPWKIRSFQGHAKWLLPLLVKEETYRKVVLDTDAQKSASDVLDAPKAASDEGDAQESASFPRPQDREQ